ncbi:esterase [Vagococcus coleopterorum]|uniref:Esterase n=1 Tax=Vagococcus coleopterorum TaxID=2714946 RepID=A0A6G8ALA3_9ENTE|nr:GDSL-type esterase/lipase family protein [Vagococcus coleopterorum]QIL45838.1 esterase [Vagococcus coleopterorum]
MEKVILFGDSITAGYTEGEITDELTKRISAKLTEVDVVNAGIPGDTTTGALVRLHDHVLRYQPQVVTVFFGANDVCPSCEVPLEQYRANLVSIVEQIGSQKVILIGLPYVNPKRYDEERPDEEVLNYNQVVREVAETYEIPFVELFQEMRAVAVEQGFYQVDGLHFSVSGYDYLAAKMIASIQEKLKELGRND